MCVDVCVCVCLTYVVAIGGPGNLYTFTELFRSREIN